MENLDLKKKSREIRLVTEPTFLCIRSYRFFNILVPLLFFYIARYINLFELNIPLQPTLIY